MTVKVSVTSEDIAAGRAADCFNCPVALALHRATGDDHANVYTRCWTLYVEAWHRSVVAPREVWRFVHAFDDYGGGYAAVPPEPFAFELPDDDDPEWKEECAHCEELRPPPELDDDGVCGECREQQDDNPEDVPTED